jgi:LPS-assembly protein
VLLNVKGVPLFYMPFFYYPTKEDERATGFLIPTYGVSTLRGQTIHNAFFWAINRSQDATFLLDWFSKTGTGTGAEYRYNRGGGSDGQIAGYLLNQKAASYFQSNGSSLTQPESRAFTLNGFVNQLLPGNFRARAQVAYFSSVTTNQTFNVNVYDAARNRRTYSANVIGAVRGVTVNGNFDRTEWFTNVGAGTTSSQVTGSSPRIILTRSERPLFPGSPAYFGVTGEVANLVRQTRSNDAVIEDRGLSRYDVVPQIRYPFKRWPFLTVNTTLNWRETFYSRSLDPTTNYQSVTDSSVNRQYFTLMAQALGPVFTRVWNTPDNRYAERFKHTIEPYLNVQRTSSISNFDRIVRIDAIDGVVGSTTRYDYGLNNRLYAKRRLGQTSQAVEILSLQISQSYYTDARASQFDAQYSTANLGAPPSKYSPVAVILRATPTPSINANVRAEIDSRHKQLRTISANGTLNLSQQVQTTIGWSHKFFIDGLPGFNDPRNLDHYLNVQSNIQTRDRRYGAIYSMNFDIQRATLLQQRVSGFYNAQCCGIAFEFQRYNFAGVPSFVIPADNRFFLSFTLAGLGNFSPFSGGMSGVPR